MNEQLKQSIITIAEYMGYELKIGVGGWDEENKRHQMWESKTDCFTFPNYHTSANALLEVWRKVRDDKDFVLCYKKGMSWNEEMGVAERNSIRLRKVDKILERIGDGNYPAACIELAEIIKQLKEKV